MNLLRNSTLCVARHTLSHLFSNVRNLVSYLLYLIQSVLLLPEYCTYLKQTFKLVVAGFELRSNRRKKEKNERKSI